MTIRIMHAILWKDYRLIRVILLSGLGLIVLGSIAPIIGSIYEAAGTGRHIPPGWRRDALAYGFLVAGIVSGSWMPIVAGVLCAGEEADRSAKFLATLPASEWSQLASKAIVGIGSVALVLALDIGLLFLMPEFTIKSDRFPDILLFFSATCWLMFGGAWLAGWAVRSPAIATVIGIGMPIVVAIVVFKSEIPDWKPAYWGGALVIGTLCLLGGGALALTRSGNE